MRLRDIVLCSAIGAYALGYGCATADRQQVIVQPSPVEGTVLWITDLKSGNESFRNYPEYQLSLMTGEGKRVCLVSERSGFEYSDTTNRLVDQSQVFKYAWKEKKPVIIKLGERHDSGCYTVKGVELVDAKTPVKPEKEN